VRSTLLSLSFVFAATLSFSQTANSLKLNSNDPADSICDTSLISVNKVQGSKISYASTNKVDNGDYKDAKANAETIIKEMTKNLSPDAVAAINMTQVIVYHCDPSLESGLKNKKPYDLTNYDYITLLPPKEKCQYFQDNPTTFDGRSWDETVGVGVPSGTVIRDSNNLQCTSGYSGEVCDTTTICDINLVKSELDPYGDETILVHEFGHTLMNVGLAAGSDAEMQLYAKIADAYVNYLATVCNGDPGTAYSCSNQDEMWAEATQGWFNATCRTDVNPGLTTPDDIKQNAPKLYDILTNVYGAAETVTKFPPYNGCPQLQKK